MDEDKFEVEKLREVMNVVSTEIPKLIESISKQIYSSENAQKMGTTVAQFYKQMRDMGMGEKEAFELTKQFMADFSLGGMIGQVIGHFPKGKNEIGEEIEKRIREKMKKNLDEED
ncbi:MAG: hypothetical protein ACUVT7_09105 [Thermoplasmata archaeon]